MRRLSGINRSLQKTRAARRRARTNPEKYRILAEFVHSVRIARGWTQAKLAEKLGVSEISVRRWESRLGHEPMKDTWRRLNELAKS